MHASIVSPSKGIYVVQRTQRACSAAGGDLDGRNEVVSFYEQSCFYFSAACALGDRSASEGPGRGTAAESSGWTAIANGSVNALRQLPKIVKHRRLGGG